MPPRSATIRLSNSSGSVFQGWKSLTVDREIPPASELMDGSILVRGRKIGKDLWSADIKTTLAPGDFKEVPLEGNPIVFVRAETPSAISSRGGPTVAGMPMALTSVVEDGAGLLLHFSKRVSAEIHVDLWAKIYPEQTSIVVGNAVVCASNPAVDFAVASFPRDIDLRCGDGIVAQPHGIDNVLLKAGETLADGQARSIHFTMAWPSAMQQMSDILSAAALSMLQISAIGIQDLWLGGNPLPDPVDPRGWLHSVYPGVIRDSRGWTATIGVTPRSLNTGAQEDQLFCGSEYSLAGAETARYLTALGQSRRPCHHLDPDGRPVDLEVHPRLVFWNGRPHYDRSVSPDQLGKSSRPSESQAHGWWGPDEEHLLYGSVVTAYRLSGSPALQWQLRHAARHFIRMVRGRTGSARAVGYRGLLAVLLDQHLESRALADEVAQAWNEHLYGDLIPKLSGTDGIWDPRRDDRLGPGLFWMPWQQALGAWGLDLACRHFGTPRGIPIAQEAAQRVVDDGIAVLPSGRYRAYYALSVDGASTVFGDSDWTYFGVPLAMAALIKDASGHAPRELAIWEQMKASPLAARWIDPSVL